MNKFATLLYLLLSCSVCATGQSLITLAECQNMAADNYPIIVQYDIINLSENYNIDNIRKDNLPKIRLSGNVSYQSDATSIPFRIPGYEGIKGQSKDQYRIDLEIEQNIWDGGTSSYKKALARVKHTEAQKQLDVNIYSVRKRVNDIYFGILLIDEKLKLNSLLMENLKRNLKTAEANIKNGYMEKTDADAIRVEILKSRQNITDLKSGRTSYLKMLSIITGKDINETDSLARPLLKKTENIYSVGIFRPEQDLFKAQRESAHIEELMLKSSYMPKINLFAKAGYGNPGLDMLKDRFDAYYIVGARFSWNFSSLYTLKNKKKEISNTLRMIDSNENLFLFNTRLQVENNKGKSDALIKIIKEDDEIISLKENIRKSYESKAANGTVSIYELLNEITSESMARQAKAMHEIEYLKYIYDTEFIINHPQQIK